MRLACLLKTSPWEEQCKRMACPLKTSRCTTAGLLPLQQNPLLVHHCRPSQLTSPHLPTQPAPPLPPTRITAAPWPPSQAPSAPHRASPPPPLQPSPPARPCRSPPHPSRPAPWAWRAAAAATQTWSSTSPHLPLTQPRGGSWMAGGTAAAACEGRGPTCPAMMAVSCTHRPACLLPPRTAPSTTSARTPRPNHHCCAQPAGSVRMGPCVWPAHLLVWDGGNSCTALKRSWEKAA